LAAVHEAVTSYHLPQPDLQLLGFTSSYTEKEALEKGQIAQHPVR
jgi:hypothetical protein